MGDQAELLEQLQRAVDGGEVDPGPAVRCTSAQISSGVPCSRAGRRRRAPAGAAGSAGSPWRVERSSCRSEAAAHQTALQGRGQVRLQRLAHGRHVVGPQQVAVRPGRRAGGRRCSPWRSRCARRRRCCSSILAPSAVPTQISTYPVGWASSSSIAAVGLGPPVAGLLGERAHLVAVVVEQPAAAEVVHERLAGQLGEGDLLAEPELRDRRVAADADTAPGAEQPGHRDQLQRHVRADLHAAAQPSWCWRLRRRPPLTGPVGRAGPEPPHRSSPATPATSANTAHEQRRRPGWRAPGESTSPGRARSGCAARHCAAVMLCTTARRSPRRPPSARRRGPRPCRAGA